MTRTEAIEILEYTLECVDEETSKGANEAEAIPMAIEALKRERTDEWCTDCADRPKGKWIYWREDGIKRCKCSRCLTSYGCLDTPYCPNCGEKMVEGRSEE